MSRRIVGASVVKVLSLLLVCAGTPTAVGAMIDGPITNPSNGHVYYLLDAASWTASEAEAIGLNGHLVTVDNEAENNWVFDTFGTDRNLWIGYYQPPGSPEPSGDWQWTSGDAASYENWDTIEPNQYLGLEEDYAHIWGHVGDIANDPASRHAGRWNDLPNLNPPLGIHLPFGVVEAAGVPEPSILVALTGLLGMGLIGYSWRRRKS